ncbi:MAG TPA: acyl-CoA dehydrogenase [Hellea balneolensis]|uniref:Acyl-CoA dehydrogenase n=1 Tax=Hellea balneolensis TaxID=287478 RepID=A0A7C5QZW6_9PROT|nr:acyl-CoA dehydrogenase [Hellea balneolensis]
MSVSRTIMVDSRNYATADFKDVEVTGEQIVGTIADAEQLLQKAFTVGQGILAAEMLGAASQVFDLTAAYLRERKQFGRIIGEFQALQHRAAHLYCELENARSAVLSALRALDNNDEKVEIFAAMAKAKLGSVAKLSALEAVQLHGGMGMTDELDIGLYLKRIRVLQELFGDGDYHADRLATLREN